MAFRGVFETAWENSGGSGSYSYLAVVGWRDGKAENIGTALIGDRVQIRDARIDGQHIKMDFEQQFFQALSGSSRFSFMVGRLALTRVHEDEWNTMLFDLSMR